MEGVLLGMGNPLLDISAVVPQEFLDKYGVRARPPTPPPPPPPPPPRPPRRRSAAAGQRARETRRPVAGRTPAVTAGPWVSGDLLDLLLDVLDPLDLQNPAILARPRSPPAFRPGFVAGVARPSAGG